LHTKSWRSSPPPNPYAFVQDEDNAQCPVCPSLVARSWLEDSQPSCRLGMFSAMVIGEIQGCGVRSEHQKGMCNNFMIIHLSPTLSLSSLPIQCITVQTRRISTHPSRSATATVTATTTAHPLQTSYPDEPQHLPDVVADDLPIISLDARQVAIGWDTRTWSRLCVSFLSRFPPFLLFHLSGFDD
jgi:hypothetical protein